ncbi:MAG: hypothetical protein LBJ15_14655 [Comamonas sp.]|jgi:hypothetical protein|uniref:hypothetical protein n=1 Tax=Comamonas sp. TaxID=34028 RepID=UPI0028218DC3|nr:hypothetical protein [Comamonas sp.]MDR0215232.1 hypothetical protein [Comamonas sp.]
MRKQLGVLALLASLGPPAWAQTADFSSTGITACSPSPQNPVVDEPYTGYQATGYKGSMERDSAWFAAVRAISQPDGSKRYVFRQAPAKSQPVFESIETLPLGGKAIGFIAYRQGCGDLLDAHGRSLGLAPFNTLEAEFRSPDMANSVLLKRTVAVASSKSSAAEPEMAKSYARFTHGKLIAISPHQYHLGDGLTSIDSANSELSASHLMAMHVSTPDGAGILDLISLHEVLEPRWQGVGQISDHGGNIGKNGLPEQSFLLGLDAAGLHLHTLQGKAIALPRFDRMKFQHSWLSSGDRPPASKTRRDTSVLIQTLELDAKKQVLSCRLYNHDLQALVDEPIPAAYCPHPGGRDNAYFAYSTAAGTQVYRKQHTDTGLSLQHVARDIPGKLIYLLDSGPLLLQTAKQPPYQLVTPEGTEIADRSFDTVEHRGCGHIAVSRGGQRWMLRQDGSLSTTMTFPFSC